MSWLSRKRKAFEQVVEHEPKALQLELFDSET
jgi:hypothetical protein